MILFDKNWYEIFEDEDHEINLFFQCYFNTDDKMSDDIVPNQAHIVMSFMLNLQKIVPIVWFDD